MNPETSEAPVPKPAFATLFATGLVGWLLGSIVLFGAAWPVIHPESGSIAAMWAISNWWMAFAFGGLLLVVRGLISGLRSSTALLAYLLPAALLAGISGICLAIYPEHGFRSDLFGYMPLALIFYAVGFLWMSLAKTGGGNSAFLRAVLPAMVGGLIILGLVAVPVFTSNLFLYRNAFGLVISKTGIANGAMVADAVLEIKKSGRYEFTAPLYVYSEGGMLSEMDPTIEFGKITWGPAGVPKEGATGSYPLQIRWEKGIPTTEAELAQRDLRQDTISLEARDPAAKDLLFNISAPLPGTRQ